MNFVWVYSREAHPEENPFAPGFETIDLGWTHPYFKTTTMEQRARRAKWMKTDLAPDAEMPMIIDYINTELGPDDAIKQAYIGGGYYSGYVIDCDGSVIYQANWSWYAPGGQWWSLPLKPVDDLERVLAAYLADPPPCYVPPASPRAPDAPGAARPDQPTILIVDDDGGDDYEGYFQIPLGNLKLHTETWSVQENGSPSADALDDFNVVVWFTGDCDTDTLTPADQANLAAYLDAGGKLFLSGQNIGQDIAGSPFYHDYLHAELLDDDTGITKVIGSDILSGLQVSFTGPDGQANQTSPSEIGLLDGAVGVFFYSSPRPKTWAGLRWQGEYQIVYFAFGLEGVSDIGAAAFRFKIMKHVFDWFDELPCQQDVTGDGLVDVLDLLAVLAAWGTPGGDGEDITGDGLVDVLDLLELLAHWGPCT